MEPTRGPAGFLNDPLNPPPAETRAYAGALAEELMFRGVKPKVVNQPALNGYLVIVPGVSAELGVEVRAAFYSWRDPAAEYGVSHAVWGDQADAAGRIIIAAKALW